MRAGIVSDFLLWVGMLERQVGGDAVNPSSIGPGLIPETIHGGERRPEMSFGLVRLWFVCSLNFWFCLSFFLRDFDRLLSLNPVVVEFLYIRKACFMHTVICQ